MRSVGFLLDQESKPQRADHGIALFRVGETMSEANTAHKKPLPHVQPRSGAGCPFKVNGNLPAPSRPHLPATHAAEPPSLLIPWLIGSAIWIGGVFFFASLGRKIGQGLVEIYLIAFIPSLLPPLILAGIVRLLAESFRP